MWKEYPKSRQMYKDAQKVFAMGVGSQVQSFGRPHPLYMARGKGSRLYDVDGNEFIDYLLNYGPNILGHSPKPLNAALQRQLAKGYGFGEPHSLQVEVSRLLIETIPSFKVVNFNNTGSEAVQAVIRLARAATGRTKFIKFEGHYHGWLDNVFFSFHPDQGEDFGTRESPRPVIHNYCKGQPLNVLDNVVVLPWNNLEYVEKAFREHPGEIAAILTEPIMSNCGVIMPRPGYLEGLRRLATAHGAMLIFDETITGLRVSLGGAQELFGVIPDITCGFKALGGGVPIFAYGASEQLMEPVARRQAVHAGTFNANAIGCCAAKAVLQELRRNGGAAVKRINEAGRYLMQEIGHAAARHGETVRIQGTGSLFCVSFHNHEIFDMRDAFDIANDRYFTFRQLLLDRGVHIFPTEKGLWYLSTAHTDKDIDATLKRVDEVFGLMKGM
jgi:glutamate-1-semialdehyde 2,1-aminomutase